MTPKTFAKYLVRDGGCLHCGERMAVAPHHRANRGMGGSKKRDVASNIIVLCSNLNGLMEADARFAALAVENGWKVSTHDDPASVPVFDRQTQQWFLLGNDYTRTIISR